MIMGTRTERDVLREILRDAWGIRDGDDDLILVGEGPQGPYVTLGAAAAELVADTRGWSDRRIAVETSRTLAQHGWTVDTETLAASGRARARRTR